MILNEVSALDISGSSRISDNLFHSSDFSTFINYHVFNMYIFSNYNVSQNYAVLDYGAFFDFTATTENRILQLTFDQASVRDNRAFYTC